LAVDESVSQTRDPDTDSAPNRGQADEKPVEADRDPLVQRALSVFGASIVKIESGARPQSTKE